jgi:hypothetical protein
MMMHIRWQWGFFKRKASRRKMFRANARGKEATGHTSPAILVSRVQVSPFRKLLTYKQLRKLDSPYLLASQSLFPRRVCAGTYGGRTA